MSDHSENPQTGQGLESTPEERADPAAMTRMIDYLIPEARQVSTVVTVLLYLARQELSVISQENDRSIVTLKGH